RNEEHLSVPRGSVPAAAEARRRLSLWGLQADLADELTRGFPFRAYRPGMR
ncbi:hypothetical protein M9458_053897, partial [Cirrhinus mrigala]